MQLTHITRLKSRFLSKDLIVTHALQNKSVRRGAGAHLSNENRSYFRNIFFRILVKLYLIDKQCYLLPDIT